MKKQTPHNYGKCEVCGGRLEPKRVSQDFWIRGKLLVVENVPAGVCARCGERVVKADVGVRILDLLRTPKRIAEAHRISVPSIRYETEEEALTGVK